MEIETITAGAPDAGTGQTETPKTEATSTEVATGSDGKTGNTASEHNGTNTEAQKAAEQRYKIKFGKNERELSVEELRMYAQKGWAADTRFQEAAKMRKEIEDALSKADFDKLIEKKTGKSALEYYKEKLKAEIRKAQMTDDERAVEEKRAELERLKEEEQEIQRAREERQREAQEAHYSEKWDKELADAIKAEGLPQTRYAISRAVQIGKKLVDAGLEPDWVAVTREAKAQIMDDIKGLMAAFKEDPALIGFLGDDLAQRISKALVGKRMGAANKPNIKAVETAKAQDSFRQKEQKPMDVDEWIAAKRKKFENS